MESKECTVCVERYNRTTRHVVTCPWCEYQACRQCYETFVLQQPGGAKCMGCGKGFTREQLVERFTRVFLNGKYKFHREQCLFELEKAMLPATQPILERRMEDARIQQHITNTRVQIVLLQRKVRELEDQLSSHRRDTATERKTFVRKCPNSECRGFLSTQWKCNLCGHYTCKECNVCMLTGEDDHKCDPADVETVKLLAKDSKACPKCGEIIFKIDGCFAEHTPILLWEGSVRAAQDVAIGDVLVGDDGSPRQVQRVCTGEDEMYTVTQAHGLAYTVNSKHTLVLMRDDRVVEEQVDAYRLWPAEQQARWYGFQRTSEGVTPTAINVTPVGRGRYYGWEVDGNHRFLLADHTVVRNCDQMYCTQCHTAFSWRTGRIETGTVHNPHYYEWLRKNNQTIDRDAAAVYCGREIDDHFVRNMVRRSRPAVDFSRALVHFRYVVLPRFRTHDFADNQELRISYLKKDLTDIQFRTALQQREKAREKKIEYYRLLSMFLQCATEIMYRYEREERELYATAPRGSGETVFPKFFDEILNLLTYVNECLARIAYLFGSQRYYLTDTLDVTRFTSLLAPARPPS